MSHLGLNGTLNRLSDHYWFSVCDNGLCNISGNVMCVSRPKQKQVLPRVYYNQLLKLRFLGLISL